MIKIEPPEPNSPKKIPDNKKIKYPNTVYKFNFNMINQFKFNIKKI